MATSNAYAHPGGRIGQTTSTSGPTLIFDLYQEIRRLQSEQPWQAEHTAKTIVKYPNLRVVLVALKAGGKLHEHKTAGRISIQALSGLLKIHTPDEVIEMPAGTLAALDHELVHDVVAEADSVFLLTIAWPEGEQMNTGQPKWTSAAAEVRNSQASRAGSATPIDYIYQQRELGLDQTLAETFPCSDPISSNPNPMVQLPYRGHFGGSRSGHQ